MSYRTRKPLSSVDPREVESTAERRRLGRIVHDDRGSASLEWVDAPPGYDRLPLSLDEPLSIKQDDSFDPYDRKPAKPDAPRARKRDLRKLSEWIKTMRELKERKARGDDDE